MNKLLLIIFCITLQLTGKTQTSNFNIYQFKIPEGFTKTQQGNNYILTSINQKTNSYCMVIFFPEEIKSDNSKSDFDFMWESKVMKLVKPESKVTPEQMENDGNWTKQSGESFFYQNNFKSSVLMTSYASQDKRACIIYMYNDTSYFKQLEELSTSVKLQNISITESRKSNNGPNDFLIGEWTNKNTLNANYVNPNGTYAGDASIFSNERYLFTNDGKYEYFYAQTSSQKTHTYFYTGTYSLQDNQLKLVPSTYVHKINNQLQAPSSNPNNMKIVYMTIKKDVDEKTGAVTIKLIGEDFLESDVLYKK